MPILVLLLFFVVMYLLMIRPQQRRARDHQALVASVEVGDEVMTTAGIYGTITALEDTTVSIEVAPGVVVRVARAAIGQRVGPEVFAEDEPPVPDEPDDVGPTGAVDAGDAGPQPSAEPPGEPRRDSPWGDWGQGGPQEH